MKTTSSDCARRNAGAVMTMEYY